MDRQKVPLGPAMVEVEVAEIIAVAELERGKKLEVERGAAEFFPFIFFTSPAFSMLRF